MNINYLFKDKHKYDIIDIIVSIILILIIIVVSVFFIQGVILNIKKQKILYSNK
jgi:hypothetical protein